MAKKNLPIGCSDRYNEIIHISDEILETFINGNKSDLLAGLEMLEPKTA